LFILFAESAEKGTKFVEDGVRELLKARRVLCGSYVYGYYLEDNGYNKTIFEFMQVILHVSLVLFQILIMKPTRCTNFSIDFWNKTLHVSDSSSVLHQEFFTVHVANLYDTCHCCVYSEKLLMMDGGTV